MRSSRAVCSASFGEDGPFLGALSFPFISYFDLGADVFARYRKHFIPLSSSYAELYNIQAFFSGFPATLTNSEDGPLVTTVLTQPPSSPGLPKSSDGSAFEGDKALQDIAEAGKHWRERFVRKADMEVRSLSLPSNPFILIKRHMLSVMCIA